MLSDCQIILIQLRIEVVSVLIWVQTVCKGNQPTTKDTTNKEIINNITGHFILCLVLVNPGMTCPDMTEKLLTGA